MSKHLLSRVIMLRDTSVHIAFTNKMTIGCTRNCLSELLAHPLGVDTSNHLYVETSNYANPLNQTLENIPGLTLLKIYSDAEIVCVFPKLFESLFSKTTESPDETIYLKELIEELDYSDEKHLLMKFFYDFTKDFSSRVTVKSNLDLEKDDRLGILSEIYNASFLPLISIEEEESSEDKGVDLDIPEPKISLPEVQKEKYYTATEAAGAIGVVMQTIYRYASGKNPSMDYVLENGVKMFSESEVQRKKKEKQEKDEKKQAKLNKNAKPLNEVEEESLLVNAYSVLQRELDSYDAIHPVMKKALRNGQEWKHYCKNGYKQVNWPERLALIIDVNPDYCSVAENVSNRDRMKAGEAPIVPNTEVPDPEEECGYKYDVYHIHHIGQNIVSPFAVFPAKVHQKLDGILHFKKPLRYKSDEFGGYKICSDDELHDTAFEMQKDAFWRAYIKYYDKAGSFEGIEGFSLELAVGKRKGGKKR